MKHILATIRMAGLGIIYPNEPFGGRWKIFGKKGAHAMLRIGVYCKAQLLEYAVQSTDTYA